MLSDRYEYNSLKANLERFLCSNMDLSNVLQLMSYADVYNAKILHKQCADYVDSHAHLVLSSQSMLQIPQEHLKTLLMRDSFFASEIAIFEAVVRWRDYNGFKTEDIEEVLGSIRLVEIPHAELLQVVKPTGLYPEAVIKEALEKSSPGQKSIGQPRGKLLGTAIIHNVYIQYDFFVCMSLVAVALFS